MRLTVQLLIKSPEKFLCMIRNLVTKTYAKFVTLHSSPKIFKNTKKIEKIHMDFEN